MKTTRKFIPALVMLIVSAIMLSTASYAWLASNTEVTAGPMTVKANTDVVFLQITNDEANGPWGRSASAKVTESGELELVNAYVDADEIAWRTAEGVTPGSHEGAQHEGNTVYDAVEPVDATYALINTFYVKMSNATSKLENLRINTVTVGDTIDAESFDMSLRLLVVATDDEDTVLGYQCYDIGNKALCTSYGFEADDVLAAEVGGDVITLTTYIYYDGEDENAFTDKLSTANARQITVSFIADEITD